MVASHFICPSCSFNIGLCICLLCCQQSKPKKGKSGRVLALALCMGSGLHDRCLEVAYVVQTCKSHMKSVWTYA